MLKLKKILLRELDSYFTENGFIRWTDPSRFYGDRYDRRIMIAGSEQISSMSVRQSVDLEVSAKRAYLELGSPYISIRLDEIENFIGRFEEHQLPLRPIDIEVRPTLGFRLQSNSFTTFQKAVLTNEEDIIKAARKFAPNVIEKATLFWQHFSIAAEILRTLGEEDEAGSRYSAGTPVLRAKKTVVLGMILYGPMKAVEIANTKSSFMQSGVSDEFNSWLKNILPSTL